MLATARWGGVDLDVRKMPVHAYVRSDGSVVTFDISREVLGKAGPSEKETVFSDLIIIDGDQERRLFPGAGHSRPDMKSLVAADPDMAPLYYHREKVAPLGVAGPLFSWMVSTSGYLGGAHPYAGKGLIVVDAETGARVRPSRRFKDRKIGRHALKLLGQEDCVRRFAGIAPLEWLGGNVTWIAVFTHEFELCRGRMRMVKVPPPIPDLDDHEGVKVADGVFEIPDEGLRIAGVVDWRVSNDADVVVLLMALGRHDRLTPPWRAKRGRNKAGRTREMRLWFKGMDSTAVIGRVTRVLSVQFLNDHPDPGAVLESFDELSVSSTSPSSDGP